MLTIRAATENDLPALCRLGDQVNQQHHLAAPDVFLPAGEPWRDIALWRQAIGRDDACCLLAEQQGEVLGFITAFLDTERSSVAVPQPFARIGTVVVEAACRGQGIGKRLISEVESWARGQGASNLRLTVWLFNQSAISLYESIGFQARSQTMSMPL